ncbi:MAG: RNA polymerase sigma factor [Acidimicrobiales bacterium]
MNQTGGEAVSERRGDSETAHDRFTLVFRTYHPYVTSYVRRRVPAAHVPDIVESVFLAAWRHMRTLPDEPLAWLYRVAAFEIRNWRRSEDRAFKKVLAARSLAVGGMICDTADAVAWADRWAAAFAALTESEREVLRLVAWEDLSAEDAASVLSCSVTAFRVRLHRARRRLVRLAEADGAAQSDTGPPREPPLAHFKASTTRLDAQTGAHRLRRKEALP